MAVSEIHKAAVFQFAPGVMLRHDEVRNMYVLNTPEKLIVLDEPGHAIASLIDGVNSVQQITDTLAALTELPVDEIGPDIEGFMAELAGKGLLKAIDA